MPPPTDKTQENLGQQLFDAITNGDKDVMVELLDKEPSLLETQDAKWRATPIIWAAYYNKLNCLQELIAREANLDACDSQQETALICAAKENYKAAARLLTEAGADISLKDHNGLTAFNVTTDHALKEILYKNFYGSYFKDNDYSVSIAERSADQSTTITTVFNFKAQTITTTAQQSEKLGVHVEEFGRVLTSKRLVDAASFLKKKNGSLHNCVIQPIQ